MTNEVIESGPWAGFEIVHRYTRAQAIADGVLVDVSEQAKPCGFRWPVAMTAALSGDCASWGEDAVRRVLRFARETIRAAMPLFTDRLALHLDAIAGASTQALIHVGPGDDGKPVVTLMYPGEE